MTSCTTPDAALPRRRTTVLSAAAGAPGLCALTPLRQASCLAFLVCPAFALLTAASATPWLPAHAQLPVQRSSASTVLTCLPSAPFAAVPGRASSRRIFTCKIKAVQAWRHAAELVTPLSAAVTWPLSPLRLSRAGRFDVDHSKGASAAAGWPHRLWTPLVHWNAMGCLRSAVSVMLAGCSPVMWPSPRRS